MSRELPAACESRLISDEMISEGVHTVRRNRTISSVNKTSPRAATHLEICKVTDCWEGELYYISRFFVNSAKSGSLGRREDANEFQEETESKGGGLSLEKPESKPNVLNCKAVLRSFE